MWPTTPVERGMGATTPERGTPPGAGAGSGVACWLGKRSGSAEYYRMPSRAWTWKLAGTMAASSAATFMA